MRFLSPSQVRAQAQLGKPLDVNSPQYERGSSDVSGGGIRFVSDPDEQLAADMRRSAISTSPTWYDEYKTARGSQPQESEFATDKSFLRNLQAQAMVMWDSRSVEDFQQSGSAFLAGLGTTTTSSADFTMQLMEKGARAVGADTVADAMDLGSRWAQAGTQHFEQYQPKDPGLWSKLAMGFGSSAAMIIPAVLTGGAGAAGFGFRLAAAGTVGKSIGALGRMAASPLGKATISGYIEASAEAGGVVSQALNRGDDEETAFAAGAKILLPVMGQSVVSNWITFSKYGRLVRGGGAAATNAIEEMHTGHLGDWALGEKEYTDFNDFALEYFEDGVIGAVIGGVTASVLPGDKGGETKKPEADTKPTLKPPKREDAPSTPMDDLVGEQQEYAATVRGEAKDLSVEDLQYNIDQLKERDAKGDKLTIEESITWAAAQDELWSRQLMQELQKFDDVDILRAVERALDGTTPDSLNRDARAMLGLAMDEIDNRGIATKELQEKLKTWEAGTNTRAEQMKEAATGEPAREAVDVSVKQNNEFFPGDGFTATITQPDGTTDTRGFATQAEAEQFKTDRERIGKVVPGETSREAVGEPVSEPTPRDFSIDIEQVNPFFPLDGFDVRIVDQAGTEQMYHFDTKEQAHTFAELKWDALNELSNRFPELKRLMGDVEAGKKAPQTVEDILAEAEMSDAEKSQVLSAQKAQDYLDGIRETVIRKMQEMAFQDREARDDAGGVAEPVANEELGTLADRARIELVRERFGDLVADDYAKVLGAVVAGNKKKAATKKKEAAKKADTAEVEKVIGSIDKDQAKADKAEVESVTAEAEKTGKKTAQKKQDKADVDTAVEASAKEAGKKQATTELSTKEVRAKVKEAGLNIGRFKIHGPKATRRLAGKSRSQVFDKAQVEKYIADQVEIQGRVEPPTDAEREQAGAPAPKKTTEPKRLVDERTEGAEVQKFGAPKDAVSFDASTVAQKNQIETLATVDAVLAEDLLAKRPISRKRLENAVKLLQDAGDKLMDKWIANTKIHGIPKDNIGQPQLVPPAVEAIQRTQDQILKQLKNLDAGRAAWDPGPRKLPSISGALGNSHIDKALKSEAPEIHEKIAKDEILTKEEHAKVRDILSKVVDALEDVARASTKKQKINNWNILAEAKRQFNQIKSQSAAVNFNKARDARLSRDKRRGDTTLGTGFGALQPLLEDLAKNTKRYLNNLLNRRQPVPWSKGMQRLVAFNSQGREKMGIGETFRFVADRWTMKMVDDLKYAKDAYEAGLQGFYVRGREISTVADLLAIGLSPYHTQRGLMRATADIAERAIHHGVHTFLTGKQKLSQMGVKEVLHKYPSIGKNYEEFGTYLRSRMIVEWSKAKPDDFTTPEAKKALRDAESAVGESHGRHPEWYTAATRFDEVSTALLTYAKQAGVYTDADIAEIKATHNLYVPMWTVQVEGMKHPVKAKGSHAPKVTKTFKKFVPGALTMHPVEALSLSHHTVMSSVHSNFARIQMAKLIRMGANIGRILDPKTKRKSVLVSRGQTYAAVKQKLKEVLRDNLAAAGYSKKETAEVIRQLHDDRITDGQVKLWVVDHQLSEGLMTFIEDGKLKLMEVDPAVSDSFAANTTSAANDVLKIAQLFTGLTRTGFTLTPEFSATNPVRDVMVSMFVGRKHIRNPKQSATYLFQWWKSLAEVIGGKQPLQEMKSAGVGLSGFHAQDSQQWKEATQKLIADGTVAGRMIVAFTHPVQVLRTIGSFTEDATRLNNFKMVLKDLKDSGNYTDEAARMMAGMAAREYSGDFQRAGEYGRVANTLIPFFNSGIVGASILVDSHRADKRGFYLRGAATLVLPTIALWMANNLDEDRRKRWEAEPDWVKHNNWVFYPTKDTKILLRKPFELGAMFASFPERVLDAMRQKDPKQLAIWARHFNATNNPLELDKLMSARLFGPFAGVRSSAEANFDPFRQAPIVPHRLNQLREVYQYNDNTSALAIWLAEQADKLPGDRAKISPIKLDFIVRANLGSGPRSIHDAIQWTARKVTGKVDPVAKPAWYYRAPAIRAFLKREPGAYDANMERFYDIFEASEAAVKSYNMLVSSGQIDKALEEYDSMADLIFIHGVMSKASDQIALFTKYIEVTKQNESLTPEQKRDTIDEYRRSRAGIARDQFELIDIQTLRKTVKEGRKTLERLE